MLGRRLSQSATAVIERVEGGASYIVTKRGRPAAVLLPIEEAEDLVLANAEEYVTMRREARGSYAKGRTTSLTDVS